MERIYFLILEMSRKPQLYLIQSSNLTLMGIEEFGCYAAVTYIDSSAVEALKELYEEYKTRDIQVTTFI